MQLPAYCIECNEFRWWYAFHEFVLLEHKSIINILIYIFLCNLLVNRKLASFTKRCCNSLFQIIRGGIYKIKKESKKTRKYAFDQEGNQEKKEKPLFFLVRFHGRERVFFPYFCFLVFFYKFPTQIKNNIWGFFFRSSVFLVDLFLISDSENTKYVYTGCSVVLTQSAWNTGHLAYI